MTTQARTRSNMNLRQVLQATHKNDEVIQPQSTKKTSDDEDDVREYKISYSTIVMHFNITYTKS
jgi:hypothetical protein